MKKLVLSLVAIIGFAFTSNAQTKVSKEEARLKFATSMSELVNQCNSSYKKGMTYDDFTQVLLGGNTNSTIPTKEGQNLIKTTYGFLSNGTTSSEIIKNYDGVEMAAVANLIQDTKSVNEAGIKIFGSKIIKGTAFGQAIVSGKLCWICGVLSWIWDNRDEIIEIVCMFVGC